MSGRPAITPFIRKVLVSLEVLLVAWVEVPGCPVCPFQDLSHKDALGLLGLEAYGVQDPQEAAPVST